MLLRAELIVDDDRKLIRLRSWMNLLCSTDDWVTVTKVMTPFCPVAYPQHTMSSTEKPIQSRDSCHVMDENPDRRNHGLTEEERGAGNRVVPAI